MLNGPCAGPASRRRALSVQPAPSLHIVGHVGQASAERFIRTLKENLLWVRSFDSVEELRAALLEFRENYNTTWLIERHGFRPPADIRQDQLQTAARAA